MSRKFDGMTEFKNGNVNIKFDYDEIEQIKSGRVSDIEILFNKLSDMDIMMFGEQFCVSNFDMGCMLYSCFNDKTYMLVFSDIEKYLMQGKTLKLYARVPDEEDREQIKEEWEA